MSRTLASAVLLLSILLPAGCKRQPFLESTVSAQDTFAMSMWRNSHARDLTPDQWKAFDVALQEFKFDIMFKNVATGSAAIEQAMYARVQPLNIRQIIEQGLNLKIARLEAEAAEYERMVALNSLKRTRPGDDDSANYLANLIKRQTEHLARLKSDLENTRLLLGLALPSTQTDKVI